MKETIILRQLSATPARETPPVPFHANATVLHPSDLHPAHFTQLQLGDQGLYIHHEGFDFSAAVMIPLAELIALAQRHEPKLIAQPPAAYAAKDIRHTGRLLV